MNRELEIFKTYKPVVMMDKNEPFPIQAMGCSVFRETKRSSSFPKRVIEIQKDTTDFVIEYAIWYDYDIQHLYELEHIWVFVAHDKQVRKIEGSFHGKYLTMASLTDGEPVLTEQTHPLVYAQPGKHAMLPDPRLVYVIPGWKESCLKQAGLDGVLIPELFEDKIHTNETLNEMIQSYIKEKFAFCPSMEFEPFLLGDDKLLSWEELKGIIPDRVNKQIETIRNHVFG
ncbi:hypothetical protein [Clostridium sp. E02]|uniref:hypothetical protein n=1 Tax=Clostridium sp. E02 TaxID=2487134 RepID=UPI000F52C9D5|nr:hypothetical protein [Clostridium sp. E02]